MKWIFYIVFLAATLGIGWAIYEYEHASNRTGPRETQHSCCYNCPAWFEDAGVECCELSGFCAKKSTGEVNCYTTWNYVCSDYSGNAPRGGKA